MEKKSPILWLDSIDSTNDEVRRHIEDLDNLSVTAALQQTAGRGQGDHKWHSTPGESLTFTLLMKFPESAPLEAKDALRITQMTTLSISSYLAGKGITARIKWPNDIWIADRKICGILIENILAGPNVRCSIIGIGLNLNQTSFPANLPNPTSVALQTGKQYDVKEELELLYKEICRHADMYASEDGRKYLTEEFGQRVFRLDV